MSLFGVIFEGDGFNQNFFFGVCTPSTPRGGSAAAVFDEAEGE